MVLKKAFAAALCTGLLGVGGPAMAAEYHISEFLGLDLSKVVLSSKRLGPETQFAPVRIEAKTDRAAARAEPAEPRVSVRETAVAHVLAEKPLAEKPLAEKPRAAARLKLARRHGNPLEAQAADTRVQTWPCRSGGICGWQR